jgi:hypothetical protein
MITGCDTGIGKETAIKLAAEASTGTGQGRQMIVDEQHLHHACMHACMVLLLLLLLLPGIFTPTTLCCIIAYCFVRVWLCFYVVPVIQQ